jgi:hypothetical protein
LKPGIFDHQVGGSSPITGSTIFRLSSDYRFSQNLHVVKNVGALYTTFQVFPLPETFSPGAPWLQTDVFPLDEHTWLPFEYLNSLHCTLIRLLSFVEKHVSFKITK